MIYKRLPKLLDKEKKVYWDEGLRKLNFFFEERGIIKWTPLLVNETQMISEDISAILHYGRRFLVQPLSLLLLIHMYYEKPRKVEGKRKKTFQTYAFLKPICL